MPFLLSYSIYRSSIFFRHLYIGEVQDIPFLAVTYPALGWYFCSLLLALLSSFQPTKQKHNRVSSEFNDNYIILILVQVIQNIPWCSATSSNFNSRLLSFDFRFWTSSVTWYICISRKSTNRLDNKNKEPFVPQVRWAKDEANESHRHNRFKFILCWLEGCERNK